MYLENIVRVEKTVISEKSKYTNNNAACVFSLEELV